MKKNIAKIVITLASMLFLSLGYAKTDLSTKSQNPGDEPGVQDMNFQKRLEQPDETSKRSEEMSFEQRLEKRNKTSTGPTKGKQKDWHNYSKPNRNTNTLYY